MRKMSSRCRLIPWVMAPAALLIGTLCLVPGCGGETPRYISIGTAPVGGTFPIIGGAVAEILNHHPGAIRWKAQIRGSKGTQENIRRLASGEFELGIANAAISYYAARGESSWEEEGAYDVRAVATLSPLVAMFITRRDTGIRRIADLKGKAIVVGPAGAGFEMFVRPILEEHGVAWNDVIKTYAPQGVSVDMLADGQADAAFLGGPISGAASISQAKSSFEVYIVPYDADKKKLTSNPRYPFFREIPHAAVKKAYRDLVDYSAYEDPIPESDLYWLNVGSMQIITHKDTPYDLVYELTKTLWNQRSALRAQHPAFTAMNIRSVPASKGQPQPTKWRIIQGAVLSTGIDFHPAAAEFYEKEATYTTDAANPVAGAIQLGYRPTRDNIASRRIDTMPPDDTAKKKP